MFQGHFKQGKSIRTISLFAIGEFRGDLHQTSLVDAHPHQGFVHPCNQLLLAHKHVVGAAAIITETVHSIQNNSPRQSVRAHFHQKGAQERLGPPRISHKVYLYLYAVTIVTQDVRNTVM